MILSYVQGLITMTVAMDCVAFAEYKFKSVCILGIYFNTATNHFLSQQNKMLCRLTCGEEVRGENISMAIQAHSVGPVIGYVTMSPRGLPPVQMAFRWRPAFRCLLGCSIFCTFWCTVAYLCRMVFPPAILVLVFNIIDERKNRLI